MTLKVLGLRQVPLIGLRKLDKAGCRGGCSGKQELAFRCIKY